MDEQDLVSSYCRVVSLVVLPLREFKASLHFFQRPSSLLPELLNIEFSCCVRPDSDEKLIQFWCEVVIVNSQK